ncbi:MAG: MFS transporter [Candidatus Helarchaeota archaeon]
MDADYITKRAETFRALLLIYSSLFVCRNILPANIQVLVDTFATTRSLIAIVIAIESTVLTISILFFGYFGEKFSQKYSLKRIFTITMFGWVICFCAMALSVNFLMYSVFDITSALFRGAYLPLAFSMVSDFFPAEERGEKYGWINFGLILGAGGGLLLGNLLGSISGFGWRLAYGIGAALAFLAVLDYARHGITPTRGKHEEEFHDLEETVEYDYKLTFNHLKQLFKSKTVGILIISVLITGIATSTLGVWALDYLEQSQLSILGANARFFSLIFYIIIGMGALPGNVWGGRLGDKYYHANRPKARISISLFGSIVGIACISIFLLIPLSGPTTGAIVLLSIFILGSGFIGYLLVSFPVGNQFAIYAEVCVPETRSSANALHGMMVNMGGIIGNLILASLIVTDNVTSFHVTILLIFWLAGGLLWIIPYFTYPKEAQNCRALMQARRKEIDNGFFR